MISSFTWTHSLNVVNTTNGWNIDRTVRRVLESLDIGDAMIRSAGALTIHVVGAQKFAACQNFAACWPACDTVSCLSHRICCNKIFLWTTQFTDQSHDACSRDVQIKAWLCCSTANMYEHDLGNTAWVCDADCMVQCRVAPRVVKHLASMPLLQRYCHLQAHNSRDLCSNETQIGGPGVALTKTITMQQYIVKQLHTLNCKCNIVLWGKD